MKYQKQTADLKQKERLYLNGALRRKREIKHERAWMKEQHDKVKDDNQAT